MSFVAAWVTSAASQALGAYLGSWRWTAATPVCRVDASPVDERLLDILREQLQRCGPPSLTTLPCPACVCGAGPQGVVLVLAAVLCLAGFVLGFSLGKRAGTQEPPVRVERGASAPVETGALEVATPSSLRAQA